MWRSRGMIRGEGGGLVLRDMARPLKISLKIRIRLGSRPSDEL